MTRGERERGREGAEGGGGWQKMLAANWKKIGWLDLKISNGKNCWLQTGKNWMVGFKNIVIPANCNKGIDRGNS